MFYKPLTKRTKKDQQTLRYNLIYKNGLYGVCDEHLTHKLDYIPEQWLVFYFSSVYKELVYDTQSLYQIFYSDMNKLNLKINSMSWDYDHVFPPMERNSSLVKNEYGRIRTLVKSTFILKTRHSKVIFRIVCPFYNIFISTNTRFLRRWLRRAAKNKKATTLFRFIFINISIIFIAVANDAEEDSFNKFSRHCNNSSCLFY